MIKFLYVLSWIPVAIVKLALAVIGLFAVPLALIGMTQENRHPDGRYFNKMWWLWDNTEDGCPEWWMKKSQEKWYTKYWPRWWWFAIRNPVNGFRWILDDPEDFKTEGNWDDGPMEALRLIAQGRTEAHRWNYKGPLAGYRRICLKSETTYSEMWFGWKVGSTVPGLGFTMQIRLDRDIGT